MFVKNCYWVATVTNKANQNEIWGWHTLKNSVLAVNRLAALQQPKAQSQWVINKLAIEWC